MNGRIAVQYATRRLSAALPYQDRSFDFEHLCLHLRIRTLFSQFAREEVGPCVEQRGRLGVLGPNELESHESGVGAVALYRQNPARRVERVARNDAGRVRSFVEPGLP